MFTVVQIGTRSAILTISPVYTRKVAGSNDIQVITSAPTTTPVLLPDGCRVKKDGWWGFIFHPQAFTGIDGNIYLNPDNKYLLTEIIVHEIVHLWDRILLGRWKFALKYIGSIPKALWEAIRKGGSWHDYHPMEVRARGVAATVMSRVFYPAGIYLKDVELVPLDALEEIQKVLKT